MQGTAVTKTKLNFTITDLIFDKDRPAFSCDAEDRTAEAGKQ